MWENALQSIERRKNSRVLIAYWLETCKPEEAKLWNTNSIVWKPSQSFKP